MENIILQTRGLSYSYKKGESTLSGINLQVKKGQIYGFLGPNGSGKTTTLSLLLGLIRKQKGSIEIFGKELIHHRMEILKKTGSLIEAPSLYGNLTARENLEIYRKAYKMPMERIDEVLYLSGLTETGNKTTKKFSLGMKQRLAIALALLPKPELLILDEPTNGLDPSGIIELRELIKRLNAEEGITIIISSHLLAEVEKMVTHLGIIVKGQMLFQGSLKELHQFQQRASMLHIQTSDNAAAIKILKDYSPSLCQDFIAVTVDDQRQAAALNKILISHQIDVFFLQPKTQDLEQLFIDLTTNLS
jgi:lantibiotic transport system ATP-binding protein